jgi:hypothetical protein
MSLNTFTESVVEPLNGLRQRSGRSCMGLRLPTEHWPRGIDPDFRDVVLERRLRRSLQRLNPALSQDVIDAAFRKLTAVDRPALLERTRHA